MKSSLIELEFQCSKYQELKPFHNESAKISELVNSINHLKELIEEVENWKILEEIKKLGPDVLGSYFIYKNTVELYWLSIGLCSILFNFPVEDFTIVVLIHELVHAYTHIGLDKDGNNWNTENFARTENEIVEGFAQLYTDLLCKDFFKETYKAFKTLLTQQASEYTEYQKWFDDKEKDKYEKIRRLLLETRRNNITNYEDFDEKLKEIKGKPIDSKN